MSHSMIFVFALCLAACGHALYMAALLIRVSDRVSNLMLSGLLLCLALRVGKSVAIFVFPELMIPANVVGLMGMSFAGPFTLLFARSLFDTGLQLRRGHLLHFLPGMVGIVLALLEYWVVYRVFTLHLLVYLIYAASWLIKRRSSLSADDDAWRWVWYVLSATFVLCITFSLQLMFYQPLVYRLIVISATLIFYGLSWWATGHARIFSPVRKQKSVVDLYRDVGKRIEQLLVEERVYVDPALNVSKLANMLKVPPYVVSRAVNGSFGKTFSELLTSYRLRHAESLLVSGDNKYTIEGIAFESGFNTHTSFYTAFRKHYHMTPAQFKVSKRMDNDKRA